MSVWVITLAVLLCALTYLLGRTMARATVDRRVLADVWEAARVEQFAADAMGRDARPNPYRARR